VLNGDDNLNVIKALMAGNSDGLVDAAKIEGIVGIIDPLMGASPVTCRSDCCAKTPS
jgi:hypothetical protein